MGYFHYSFGARKKPLKFVSLDSPFGWVFAKELATAIQKEEGINPRLSKLWLVNSQTKRQYHPEGRVSNNTWVIAYRVPV